MNKFILHCFNFSIFDSPNQLDRDSNRFLRSSSPFTGFAGKRHCRLLFFRFQYLHARFRFRSSEITNLRLAPLLFFDQSSHTDSKWSRRRKMKQKMKNNQHKSHQICYSYLWIHCPHQISNEISKQVQINMHSTGIAFWTTKNFRKIFENEFWRRW